MADIKLTREYVESWLAASLRGNSLHDIGMFRELCRHYLATEQDTRDAARWQWYRDSASDVSCLFNLTKFDGGHWASIGSRWIRDYADRAADAAITQKESP